MVRIISFLWVASVLLSQGLFAAQPTISSIAIEGTNLVVRVTAPQGVRKITLETRAQLVGSAWAPRAVHRFDSATTNETEVAFTFPRSELLEILRLRTDDTEALPASFFRGTNQFVAPQTSGGLAGPGTGVLDSNGGPVAPPERAPEREVVESDIWKVSGDTLYFFNNYRGLQVIDISSPENPGIRGSFPLAASGEQMYVLPSGHAVLLTRSWCSYNPGSDQSKVVIIDTTSSPLSLAKEVGVQGYILESRMVGSALYVVTQTYEQRAENGSISWESGTKVTSIDLSNPAAAVVRNTLFLPGYSNTISANEDYLFVVTQSPLDWNFSDIRVVDVSSPDGVIATRGVIRASGRVQDKFKMNLDGNILTVVSQASSPNVPTFVKLETFSLANPDSPKLVGSLVVVQNEQVFATRFDGKRAYVVTYRRIDPLWIVDLTDPAHPTISGELHVPGWSTYLRPLGDDRLLALGIDDTNGWRVALSLFDVSNAKSPALLSKVIMGENQSWSEANGDEKALTVLPDAGLLLVPWQTYSPTGYISSVQLVDLNADTLTARGQITGQLNPRRATLHHDHVLSISGHELVSYLAADRDHPSFKSELELAWPVDKVFLVGDYLIELQTGGQYYWDSVNLSALRIARADAPESVLKTIVLSDGLPIAGAELRDGKLYLAQSQSRNYGPYLYATTDATSPTNVPANPFIQTIWDTSQLPELPLISSVTASPTNEIGTTFTAHWPKPDLLVWSASGGGYYPWYRGGPMAIDALWWGPWWGYNSGGHFLAFDVSNAAEPVLKSEVNLSNDGFNFSKGVVANGMIYLSHQRQETIELPVTKTNVVINWDGSTNTELRLFMFVTKHYLDVIDYADPASPVVRKPVNIPGQLQGLTHNGGVLYTLGAHVNTDGTSDFRDWLDASAYDGVSAFLIDSIALTNWPRPITLKGADLFVGQSLTTTNVDRWRLSDAGMFEKLSTTTTKSPINAIRFIGDLAIFNSDEETLLYDSTDPANLKQIGRGPLNCYTGNDLEAADGSLTRGLWQPIGDYGVRKIAIESASP